MPLVEIKLIENTLSSEEKHELIRRVTDAVVSVEGESMRPYVWVLIQPDVPSGNWGVAGQPITTEMAQALRAGKAG